MEETEKVEIMNFDQKGYLKDGEELYKVGKKMAALADKVAEEGYDAVFLLGVGGTWDELMQLEYMMNKFGDKDLECYLIHAAEYNVSGHKRMTEKSVVLTASDSGTTPEILQAITTMKEQGVRVFAMTKPEGPIGQAAGAENCVQMASDHGSGGCEGGYYLADCFGLRLLYHRGCFPKYDAFIEQTRGIWSDLLDIRKRFEPKAEEIAKKYALAPYTMFIGGGALWGETILFAMCILEEMQWKRTRYVTSADFFHGTLELVEPGVPVILFKGEDEYRALDNRVEAFLKSGVTGDDDVVVIDTAEYAIEGLDPEFRVIVSPWILTVLVTDRVSRYYETVTKHNLQYRRYYHQFDY
ncbi:SIS domain-containing protein [Thermophilibacter immobilis]|uniref:SIS domain-containing protein n=1 Tax=Thermophilibacter immobilis TaxID=2779519 RepID=A0A7S7M8W9_9ACTN|nr:SIS domain-containing protein [Thermophilibacter immobilis]QOY60023.1 SIS domain-containing protein [Thermophilibacter immobilis]